jgi:hypothetical protein
VDATQRSLGATGEVGKGAFFEDNPGFYAVHPVGSLVFSMQYDFEFHFVCLRGLEKGATYGGVKWGFKFKLTNPGVHKVPDVLADYTFTSYATKINGPPSNIWVQIYRQHMK